VRNAGLWTALEGAALDDAALFFEQASGLHRRIHAIRNELREAEAELGIEATEERFAAFVALNAELNQLQQIDALVEGFGVLSGRAKSVG
jgi:DNA primase